MSYDVAVVLPPIAERDSEAWDALDLETDQQGSPPALFRTLHDRLIARFPCLSSLPDDRIEEGVWSIGPLWPSFGQRAVVLTISYSRVEEVLPFLIETAGSLGLPVFDLSSEQIHRPNGVKGLRLTVENKPLLTAPTLRQIHEAVEALTPCGGPGFMILEDSKDHVQAAGGKGAFTAEWREHSDRDFRHWVAGLPGRSSSKDIAIATNGFNVTVKENERLSAEDVKLVFSAFAKGESRPETFVWRDVTESFV